MYGFLEMECDRQNFLSFRSIFCPFTPLTTCKIKILEKWKKYQGVWSFYTCVPWMTIIGCMILDIWKVTVRIIWHFGSFFCPINPVTTQEIKILKKWKKHLEILSIYSCLPNDNHDTQFMRYGAQGTELFVILGHFLLFYPFTPLKPWKTKIKKNEENTCDNIILHKCTKNYHMPHCSQDMLCDICDFYCHFGLFFALLPPPPSPSAHPPSDPKKQNF